MNEDRIDLTDAEFDSLSEAVAYWESEIENQGELEALDALNSAWSKVRAARAGVKPETKTTRLYCPKCRRKGVNMRRLRGRHWYECRYCNCLSSAAE